MNETNAGGVRNTDVDPSTGLGTGRMPRSTVTGHARVTGVPRRTSTPQVPAARKSPAVLSLGAHASSLEHLEYAS
ncbi:hypothetical protein [Streptomyces sp. NPDC046862]|uniref:hypothetical protein n=1 Tax=Streptomyces sp. NPDC046862 TaxID=3154603 RepID=UPI003453640F